MFRKILLSAAAAALISTSAWAEPTMVRDVAVTIDLAAIQNPQAATYWTTIANDLQAAIIARLSVDQISDDGVRISVDLSELELSNSFQEALNIANSKLAGKVNITSNTDNSEFESYELAVTMEQAALFVPEGTDLATLTQDSPVYYSSMVNAFAQAIADKLQ